MADFPDFDPAPGMTKSSAPATRTVQFGDGYETRILMGLNQNPKIYNLTFNVSESESDTIEAFLDARAADSASFTYTPPGESSASNFVCEEWSKSIPFPDRATIQATFRQVFEP
jgi:phage-related protein